MNQVARVRVLVADDHSVYRMGLRELLEHDAGIEVVEEASSGEEAVQKAREMKPDVVIMDVRMPRMNGIEAARQIKQELPNIGMVMISAIDSDAEIFEAIEAGANGYIFKDEDPKSLVQAVLNASQGRAYLPPTIAKRVLDRVADTMAGRSPRGPNHGATLTEREISVLKLLAQGRRNREIAAVLGISERTVGNHIVNIYNKLHIKDRAQAIMYAVRKGLIKV